jgi:exonuclease SbcC
MIEAVRLLNFQRHKRLVVRFDPKVTTIIGSTDVGKSSVIRALTWVFTNSPSGDDFITWGETRTQVDVKVDGRTITRVRGKGENSYALDGKVFKAFSTDVPDEIRKLLKVGDINLQTQYDAPFWFSIRNKAEIGRQLNKIVDLSVIDESISKVSSLVRTTKTKIVVIEERLDAAKIAVDRLKHVKEMDADLVKVEELEDAFDKASARYEQLANLVWRADSNRTQIHALSDESDALGDVLECSTRHAQAQQARERLDERIARWERCRNDRDKAVRLYEDAHEHYHKKVGGHTCPLCLGKGKL